MFEGMLISFVEHNPLILIFSTGKMPAKPAGAKGGKDNKGGKPNPKATKTPTPAAARSSKQLI